jgi:hypothetical protein
MRVCVFYLWLIPQLLNPDRPGRLTRESANPVAGPVRVRRKTGKCKKPARPGGLTHDPRDPGKPGRDPVFVMHKLSFVKSKLDP